MASLHITLHLKPNEEDTVSQKFKVRRHGKSFLLCSQFLFLITFGFIVSVLNADISGGEKKKSGCEHSESSLGLLTWCNMLKHLSNLSPVWEVKTSLSHPLIFFSVLQDKQIDARTAEPSLKRENSGNCLAYSNCHIASLSRNDEGPEKIHCVLSVLYINTWPSSVSLTPSAFSTGSGGFFSDTVSRHSKVRSNISLLVSSASLVLAGKFWLWHYCYQKPLSAHELLLNCFTAKPALVNTFTV